MSSPLDSTISVFQGVGVDVLETIPLGAMLRRIHSGTYRDAVAHVRQLKTTANPAAYKAAKEQLASFTPCCALTSRKKTVPWAQKLLSTTNVVQYDFDHVPDPVGVKRRFAAHPSTVYAFDSPGGDGLKVGIAAEGIQSVESYRAAWAYVLGQLKTAFPDQTISEDPLVKFLHALCFVSYDPDAYINPDAVPLVIPTYNPDDADPFADAPPASTAGADFGQIASALAAIPVADDYATWLKIGMALHSTQHPMARALWDGWSAQSPKYEAAVQATKWASFRANGLVTADTLQALARQRGWRPAGWGQPPVPAAHQPALITHCVADVQPEKVEWLWKPYIALGTLCMLDGDPGIGKSLLMLQIAANISQDHPFPDQTGKPTLRAGATQNVLIMTREDSLSMTIRPRLDASDADVRRVFVSANWLDAEGKEQTFTLKHLPLLEAELQRLHPRLVLLDPIQSFFGDADMHRANQTRPLLDALGALAATHHCAIVCIRHPAKPGEGLGKALHRGLGSVDLIGTARTGLFVEQYPGDDTRALMAQTKSNLGPKGRTLIFSKTEGVFAWRGITRLTDDDLAGSGRGPNHRAFLEALLWLEKRLDGGLAWNSTDIETEAEGQDISSSILKRAKKALGVVSAQIKGASHAGWTMRLPPLVLPREEQPSTDSSDTTESSESSETPDLKSTSYPSPGVSGSEPSVGPEGSEVSVDGGVSASDTPEPPPVVPAFSAFTAQEIACAVCRKAQPVHTAAGVLSCAVCGATLGSTTATEAVPEPCLHEHVDDSGVCNDCGVVAYEEGAL